MSVEEVADGLDNASELLPIQTLQTVQSLLTEATQALYAVAAESDDLELAEVLESWQHSTMEIEKAVQLCAEVKTRIAAYRAEIVGGGSPSSGTTPGGKTTGGKPANRAEIDPNKFKYFFGKVTSSKHSKDRSKQNVDELSRIRIFDTPEGRETVRRHLEGVVSSDSNIIERYSDKYGSYQIRDSLLAGPGGFIQLNTTWQETGQGLRLTTMIPKRGKK